MRRTTAAVIGTIAGTALLVGAKLGGHPVVTAGPPAPAALVPDDVSTPALPSTTGASPTPSAVPTTSPSSPGPTSSQSRTPTPGRSRTKSASPSPSDASRLKNGTFTGAASTNQYGTIKVTVTVSGGRMTEVSATYPTTPERTAQVNAKAIPALRQEALAAQSADIASVSGATYTSTSYKTSLQSALNAAK